MEHNNEAAAVAATIAGDGRPALLADLLGQVAGCFPRRETRQTCAQVVNGLLMELEDRNCWTIAEAIGHRGQCRLHHFLSRAVWDEELVLDIAAGWAAARLDDGDGILIIDETGDAKSSADAAATAAWTSCCSTSWATSRPTPAAPSCCSRSSPRGKNGPRSRSGPTCRSAMGHRLPRPRLVAAIVDRVTFNAHILETGTQSYRLRTSTTTSRSRKPS